MAPAANPRLSIRIVFDETRFFGPGKADLLAGIARTGSIAAAGRDMGMSYKRAWDLVQAMNAMFAAPLVAMARGGAKGGGATLTDEGERVLALYHHVQDAALGAGDAALRELAAKLSDI
jgi:molybdate transport system regulatory protein